MLVWNLGGFVMPVYEYECKSCGEKFERKRGIAESDSKVKCPKCGAKEPRRVFSAFARGPSSFSGGSCAPGRPT
jgi:putative FmdB family regulatory protein